MQGYTIREFKDLKIELRRGDIPDFIIPKDGESVVLQGIDWAVFIKNDGTWRLEYLGGG